jgi:predicted N-acetyltransferase YhbS
MLKPDQPINRYRQMLNDSLLLRTAETEQDVLRVAEFNGLIHGPGVAGMTRDLFLRHPDTSGDDLIFVEDQRTGQVVSSLCLIPWTWHYEESSLTSGEMGIVGTREEYRRQGLIRAQVSVFQQRLRVRGCALSHIQGIAYYYRQFGYQYAMPLEGGLRVTRRDVHASPLVHCIYRRAGVADIPVLMRLYAESSADTQIGTQRPEHVWRYLLTTGEGSEMECETWLMLDDAAQIAGYFRLPAHHFGEELTVNEVSRLGFEQCVALLHHLVTLAEERHTPGVRLCLPATSVLTRVAASFGAHDLGNYAWQVSVPDVVAFLRSIAPTLQRRVRQSPFAELSRDVPIGLYRQTVRLRFVGGVLTDISDVGFGAHSVANIPPQAFAPLALGYRSLQEQQRTYNDLNVSAAFKLLLEVLFPPLTSFLYTLY